MSSLGGSSRCAFQIGVIEALAELGVTPSLAIEHLRRRVERRHRRRPFRVADPLLLAVVHAHAAHKNMRDICTSTIRRGASATCTSATSTDSSGPIAFAEPDALPLFVSVTRFGDGANVIFNARDVDDPLQLLLATNYLPPFYTHRPVIDGVVGPATALGGRCTVPKKG